MWIRLRKLLITLTVVLMVLSCQSQAVRGNSLKILLPLYVYPNWYEPDSYVWSEVISASAQVPITVIINPNNGNNGQPPNEDYQKGLADLRQTNVTILGYVYTQYGDRPIEEVKNEIDLYARYYKLEGIFVDETANNQENVDYYQELYHYVKTQNILNQVIVNPGTDIDEIYLNKPVADTAVIVENYPTVWERYQPKLHHKHYQSDRFAALIHSVKEIDTMKNYIDLAIARNFGYIYITDDSPQDNDGNPWNSLPSYWQEEVRYLQTLK